MNSQYTTLALYIIVLMIVLFSCDFLNPLIDDNGSLAIRCIIDKNFLSKTSDNSSPLEITRIRCIVYKDGGIKKDFNLTKDGNRFKGSVKLKKGDYDISIEAYDESDFNAYSGRQEGVEVSPIKTTEVTINLEPTEVYLTTKISPLNTGDISKSPDKNSYIYNETVQLTASPSAGYQFDHWEGDLSGTDNIANITLNGNKTVTAVFVTVSETVSIPNTLTGPTSGKVGQILSFVTGGSTSNLGHSVEYRFDWGDGNSSNWGSVSQSYAYNNVGIYQVKAQARCQTHTNIMSGWSSPLTDSISGHPLSVTVSPFDSGTVTKNPDKTEYNHNESVQLTATPSSGYKFDHWGGDLSGNNNPTTITMNSNKNITAFFVVDSGSETISTPITPYGLSSGIVGQSLSFTTGGSTSNLGHTVEYRFDWGDSNYSNWGSATQSYIYNKVSTYQIKSQARCQTHTNVVSNWSSPANVTVLGHKLSVSINPSGSGTVTKDPNKTEYDHNESVQLTASSNSGYQFDHWEGDLSGNNNPENIIMNGNKNVTAVFTLTKKLVAYYPFDGNATDESGNGHHGTQHGGVGYVLGVVGQAASFDGNDDYITVDGKKASHFGIDGNKPRSVSFWIYFRENYYGTIFSLGTETLGGLWAFAGGNPNFWRVNGYGSSNDLDFYYPSSPPYESAYYKWTHFVIIYDGTTEKVYINKALSPDRQKNMPLNTGNDFELWIGRPQYGSTPSYWNGWIDELRIYNYALSETEIQSLFDEYKDRIPLTNGLVAYYPFEGNANDVSGNSYHGTEYGGVSYITGVVGQAAKFDGVNDWIDIGTNHPFTNGTEEFTIVSWYYADGDFTRSNYNGLISLLEDITQLQTQITFGALWENQKHNSCFNVADYRNVDYSGQYGYGYTKFETSANKWLSIVGTLKKVDSHSILKLYIDGNFVDSDTSKSSIPIVVKGGKLQFGYQSSVYPNRFHGLADEIRVYNRALSDSEIKTLYDSYK